MFKKNKLLVLIMIGVELLVLRSYWKVFSGFFQQDEWLSFARHFLLTNYNFVDFLKQVFTPSVGHYQPFNLLILQSLFLLFGLNYLPYAITSVILHLIVVGLVFILARQIFKDNKSAILVALLFGISASIYQTSSWVLADIGIHFSTIFALLSLFFIFKFVNHRKPVNFIISNIFLITALLFKESVIGLFLLLPLSIYLFSKKTFHEKKLYLRIIAGIFIVYFLMRILMIFLPQAYSKDSLVTQTQPPKFLIFNAAAMPFKGFSQVIFPQRVLLYTSEFIANFIPIDWIGEPNTTNYDLFVEGDLVGIISMLITFLFLVLVLRQFLHDKKFDRHKITFFSLGFILLNLPIFAFAPEKFGIINIIDSRNLYFASIGVYMFIVSFIKNWSANKFITSILMILIVIFNIYNLEYTLTELSKVGALRKNILETIKKNYPTLSKRVVFYTESDRSYYGLSPEDRILPFQSGFGQTLLIWYYPIQKFPKAFIEGRYLWEIKDQGYREAEGIGFGYFRNHQLLQEALINYNISPDSIIAFSWNGDSNSLKDITLKTRESLRN